MDRSDSRFEITDPRFDAGSARPEADESRFETEYGQPMVPPAKRSKWMPCLIGCGAVFVLGVVLFALVAYWAWQNWRDLTATWATEAMNQMIDATDLPLEEQREMKAEVRRVVDAFREGRVTIEQLMLIVSEMVESPLMPLFAVAAVEKQYFERSGLTEEEKVEGRRTLQRFVRGRFDETIDEQAVDAVLAHVADRRPDGTWNLRDRVSDRELRAALAEAKRQADEAGVPEEPEPFDAAAEFRRIVDEVLGEP